MSAKELLIADLAKTVGRYIRRAEQDAQQAVSALIKIRDTAVEGGVCRWCGGSTHLYSCPASVAGSFLVFCDESRKASAASAAAGETEGGET